MHFQISTAITLTLMDIPTRLLLQVTFDSIWKDLTKERGEENMVFPKEIMWLEARLVLGECTPPSQWSHNNNIPTHPF